MKINGVYLIFLKLGNEKSVFWRNYVLFDLDDRLMYVFQIRIGFRFEVFIFEGRLELLVC